MEDEAAKEDFEALDDIEDIEDLENVLQSKGASELNPVKLDKEK